jgi:hypothetical protein
VLAEASVRAGLILSAGELGSSIHPLMEYPNHQRMMRMNFIEDHMRANCHRTQTTMNVIPTRTQLGKPSNAFKGGVDTLEISSGLILAPFHYLFSSGV